MGFNASERIVDSVRILEILNCNFEKEQVYFTFISLCLNVDTLIFYKLIVNYFENCLTSIFQKSLKME